MASFLRKIVAGPRAPHPEANLDLCYVTDNIIATSGPSGTFPTSTYRNPLPQLVKWLDDNHGREWAIWEFRAEGTGYPDSEVYGRIHHFPWPDHHPPPFHLVPHIMSSMREWADGKDLFPDSKALGNSSSSEKKTQSDKTQAETTDKNKRMIVVHCKAGKGRSGSMAVSYLLSQEKWTRDDALQRFTDRRMRPGFGAGISIPSQLRWIGYVERWTAHGKYYVEQQIQIVEVHVWGLRDGVKLSIEGYPDAGRRVETVHTFGPSERRDVDEPVAKTAAESSTATRDENEDSPHLFDVVSDVLRRRLAPRSLSRSASRSSSKRRSVVASPSEAATPTGTDSNPLSPQETRSNTVDAVFRPAEPIYLPTNDVNFAVERKAHGAYGWTMVTSVAHVWFNAFFEGHGPENMASSGGENMASSVGDNTAKTSEKKPDASGVFNVQWDHMDGLKGSSKKGTRAFDRAAVVWRVVPAEGATQTQATTHTESVSKAGSESVAPAVTSTADIDSTPPGPQQQEQQAQTVQPPAATDSGLVVPDPAIATATHTATTDDATAAAAATKSKEKSASEEDEVAQAAELAAAAAADSDEDANGVRRGITAAS